MIRTIVAGTHRPVAVFLGVPGDRQLNQFPFGRAMQVATGVIAGADDIVDGRFDDVSLSSVEAGLMAALEPAPVARDHRVITIGRAVIKGVAGLIVLDDIFRARTEKRASHPGKTIGPGDVLMAGSAESRIYVIRCRGRRRRL